MSRRQQRTRSSMLWGAWADALGFISELTTAENLRRRTRGRDLDRPMAWSRIVGGRMGVRVELPEGCYSDDTQLRLATSRAIANHGFDVEAFARVELPVWPGYALGGGRASRAAAASMGKQQANWANNFFDGWEKAGGNGAAMRIQPHVYAANNLSSFSHLDDVIRNAVVTHGHPRGIVGAVFHAVGLSFALERGVVPGPSMFSDLLDVTRDAITVFDRQPELRAYWRPQWERKMERSFEAAWMETVDEVADALRVASPAWDGLRAAGQDRDHAMRAYDELVHALRLDDEQTRGSATLTSVAALLLASAFPDHPAQSAQVAASRLQTDTDTIGTMAAAIVGAASPRPLLSPVMDEDYLISEADRLCAIAEGRDAHVFPYPDLLSWQPPRSALETSGLAGGELALSGISRLTVIGEPTINKDGVWVWTRTNFGQSVLIKHRHDLRNLARGNWPVEGRVPAVERLDERLEPESSSSIELRAIPGQLPLFDSAQIDEPGETVESVLHWLARTEYRDEDLGKALRIIARNGTTREVSQLAERMATELTKLEKRDRLPSASRDGND
jgi:ADP-ribosylglycohydrolase